MLAWPSFASLKQAFPKAEIIALVPAYTAPVAQLCPSIDRIILDPGPQGGWSLQWQLLRQLRQEHIDLQITLFSTTRIGLLGWLAGIPSRWAPATKLAQLFYPQRLKQRRSLSEKPEYHYNLDLAEAAIRDWGAQPPVAPEGPFLAVDDTTLASLRQKFQERLGITTDRFLVFIHSGSGGSANNLSLAQYAELAERIADPDTCFILTAGPGEEEATRRLQETLNARGLDCRLFNSREGLASFARHLALADLFIAGSTGTLHIAGALDRPTVGFYPNRRSSTPLRWQTLNRPGRYLAFTPPEGIEKDMDRVNLEQACREIRTFIQRLKSNASTQP